MNKLQQSIMQLCESFTSAIFETIRTSSLEDLAHVQDNLASVHVPLNGASLSAPTSVATSSATSGKAPRQARAQKPERLARRTQEDIDAVIGQIVTLLKAHPEGLRAEVIRENLSLDAKELPRPIADALATKVIRKTGDKRATTYFLNAKRTRKPAKKAAKAAPKRTAKRGKVAKVSGRTATEAAPAKTAAA
jgi:hypothetical protein